MSEENPGLYNKYTVTKTDGSHIDEGAVYFVLRVDSGSSDRDGLEAARAALRFYADYIIEESMEHLRPLADDIREHLDETEE